ncbi:MAG TPA: SRPBCC domain-containing protein [Polyangiaceae bacterium]|jgi:uncharacterized protein YndB with AHSA1/START domain|nr:SRPBCC domain-containing protein [Polyangiaceae bacterium]
MSEKNRNAAAREGDPREVTLTRTFDVPARILFTAHSSPEHVLVWFGPPSCPLALCEMDFRVGGRYRFAMKNPEGKLMTPFSGEYLEIEKDGKISYSNTMELPNAETMIVTLTFEESNGKTTLTHHTRFGSAAMKSDHLGRGYFDGVGASLELLAALADTMKRGDPTEKTRP